MIDLEKLSDKLLSCVGLMDALHELILALPVPKLQRKEFNSVLAVADCLSTELNNTHNLLKEGL